MLRFNPLVLLTAPAAMLLAIACDAGRPGDARPSDPQHQAGGNRNAGVPREETREKDWISAARDSLAKPRFLRPSYRQSIRPSAPHRGNPGLRFGRPPVRKHLVTHAGQAYPHSWTGWRMSLPLARILPGRCWAT